MSKIVSLVLAVAIMLSGDLYATEPYNCKLRPPIGNFDEIKEVLSLSIDREAKFALAFITDTVIKEYNRILKGGPEAARRRINRETKIKGDQTPATYYDVRIEQGFRTQVAQRFPEYGVLAEELKDLKEWTQFRPEMFTLDPIDGTKRFVEMDPHFGTLAGFYKNQEPQFGMGYWPLLNLDGSG